MKIIKNPMRAKCAVHVLRSGMLTACGFVASDVNGWQVYSSDDPVAEFGDWMCRVCVRVIAGRPEETWRQRKRREIWEEKLARWMEAVTG